MRRITFLSTSLVLLQVVTPTPAAGQAISKIDVVINLVANSGVSREKAEAAVTNASSILRDAAGIEFNVAFGVANFAHPAFSNEGDFDQPAFMGNRQVVRDLFNRAANEIQQKTGNAKGIKLYFVRNIVGFKRAGLESDTSNGWGPSHSPLGVISGSTGETPPFTERPAADMGETIAHEVGHMLGLVGDPRRGTGYPIAPNVTSDIKGHAGTNGERGETGDENLMAAGQNADGSRFRRGTHLTPSQIQIIKQNLRDRGKQVSQVAPSSAGQKDEQQYALAVDNVADQSGTTAAHLDVMSTLMHSTVSDTSVHVKVTVADVFPAGTLNASYRVLLNSDANTATGVLDELTGLQGIDREVRVRIMREAPGAPLMLAGSVFNPSTAVEAALPEAPLVTTIFDVGERPDVAPVAIFDGLQFDVPKSLLALGAAADVPFGVSAETSAGVHDIATGTLQLTRWLKDASMNLSRGAVSPGDPVSVEITGLVPGQPFTFHINGEVLGTASTDATGRVAGTFAFPSLPPGEFVYALRARDTSGEAAFNLLNNALPTLRVDLNRHVAVAGDVQRIDAVVSNLGAAKAVNVYFGMLQLATSASAALCPNGDSVILFADGFTRTTQTCLSNARRFDPVFRNIAIPGAMPRTVLPGLVTFTWPPSTPAGIYAPFLVLTTPDMSELVALGADALYFGAVGPSAPRLPSQRDVALILLSMLRQALGGR